jgi:diguanylate cyclase (GGDEF)-like protein/PAS domain S-box-containing protein
VVLTGVPEQFETYLEPLRIWLFVTVYSPEKEHFVAIFQNITEQKKFIEEIRIAAATFETHDAIVITDAEANIIKVNRAFTKVTGYTQEEVAGKNPRIMNSGRHDKAFFENLFQVVLSEGSWEGEIWDKRKNGEIYPRSMTVTAIKDAQNKITSFVGIFRDITERKQAEEALRKAEQRFRFMLENSPIAVRIASKATGKVVYANRNYAELIGYPQEQAIGIDPQQFYANQQDYYDIAEQLGKGENVINKLVKLDSKSELKWALASFMLSEFENEPAYLAWLYDISDRKKMEEQVEHLAFYDTLTELPNRRLLNDRLQQAVYANKRSGKYGVVMFLDLDKFKPLNDTHGHVVGDLLLLEVGRRISSCVRDTDTVARFGGDEFVVMLNELDIDETQSKTESGNVAEKIRACLSETYFLKTQQEGAEICVEHHCSSSIGVTLFNGHELNHDVIFKQADAAMYKAKEGGGNLVCLYEEGMDDL